MTNAQAPADGPQPAARPLAEVTAAFEVILDAIETNDPRLVALLARDGMTVDDFMDRIVDAVRPVSRLARRLTPRV
jgi:hypothetical protein